ncbi:MAG: hypothetical protein LUD47_05985 [Clostridia bacterium]|nr:hypothetical protein [Clostridia bacterium]
MPTSSIFANVIIESPESVRIIAEALDEAEKSGPREMTNESSVASPEEIREFIDGKEIV